ncbi:hypothetical protein N2152v2_003900 [Parachlorella kessleri]
MLSVLAIRQSSLLPILGRAPLICLRGFAAGSSKVVELLSDDEYQKALKDLTANKSTAVIDFTAKWCGPCKMIAPIYEKLSTENPDIRFYKIDIDQPALQTAVTENLIGSVPTFIFYRGADRVGVLIGADKEPLQAKLRQLHSEEEMAYAIREHSITAVPTFVGYQAGERAGAFSGADKGELQRLVRQLKGSA